jgi:hypothetical protein
VSLTEQIQSDLKEALKSKNEAVVSTLRLLQAVMKNAEIAKMREKLTEEEIEKLIKTEIKKRREAVENYRQGGRPELADKEEGEVKILEKYLPEQMGEDEIGKIILKVIAEVKPAGPQDFGKVMKAVTAEVKGRADGKTVSEMIKKKLGN